MQALAHRRIRRSVSAHVDTELPAPLRARVSRHIADCPGCRDDLEILRVVKASLDRLGRRRPVALGSTRLSRFAWRLREGAAP